MKRILCAALLAMVFTTPAFAAKLYLKSGGYIQAKRVWHADGRVYVLATRDTMTSFEASEVDLNRTFVKRHRAAKKIAPAQSQVQTTTAAPNGAAVTQKTADKKAAITLPDLPKLPQKTPDSLMPSSGGDSSIRQHKKNMAEKTGE